MAACRYTMFVAHPEVVLTKKELKTVRSRIRDKAVDPVTQDIFAPSMAELVRFAFFGGAVGAFLAWNIGLVGMAALENLTFLIILTLLGGFAGFLGAGWWNIRRRKEALTVSRMITRSDITFFYEPNLFCDCSNSGCQCNVDSFVFAYPDGRGGLATSDAA